jgi:hypothetical protein
MLPSGRLCEEIHLKNQYVIDEAICLAVKVPFGGFGAFRPIHYQCANIANPKLFSVFQDEFPCLRRQAG